MRWYYIDEIVTSGSSFFRLDLILILVFGQLLRNVLRRKNRWEKEPSDHAHNKDKHNINEIYFL